MTSKDSVSVPFMVPSIGEEEIENVVNVMKSGWLTTGNITREFEEKFASYVGAKHALAVNSATAGLHLALEAAGVGPGDKVIVPVMTFTATAEVVRYLGADPVFVDADPKTYNISISALENALKHNGGAKAIIPVHFAGLPCEMKEIQQLADKWGATVVEDAAHALPSTYDGKLVGSLSTLSVFSFYVTKTITTGEGGMVTTDDDKLAKRIKMMRLHGISKDIFDRYTSNKPNWYYEVVAPGYKYNLTDIASAIGIQQLRKAEGFRAKREAIAAQYDAAFADMSSALPPNPGGIYGHSWHLYILRLDTKIFGVTRDSFIEELASKNVGASVHFIPLHMHPYWRDTYKLSEQQFPVATMLFNQFVSLPLFPDMTQQQVEYVTKNVRKVLGND